jgi:hypothetical protein
VSGRMVDALSEGGSKSRLKTAFVLAGGGSFGAIQVGMLHSLVAHAADRSDGRAPVGMVRGAAFVGTFAAVLAGKSSSRGVEWGPSNKTGATSELDSDRRNFAMDGNFGMGQFGHGVVHHCGEPCPNGQVQCWKCPAKARVSSPSTFPIGRKTPGIKVVGT